MKKLLLALSTATISFVATSQMISENFDKLTIGNFALGKIESGFDKLNPAQGDWSIISSVDSPDSMAFQVVSENPNSNILVLSGPQTQGENIVQKTLHFTITDSLYPSLYTNFFLNTKDSSGSKNEFTIAYTTADRKEILAGFHYSSATRKIQGVFWDSLNNTETGLSTIELGLNDTPVYLDNDSTYFCSINYNFKKHIIFLYISRYPNIFTTIVDIGFIPSYAFQAEQVDLFVIESIAKNASDTSVNTLSQSVSFDNIQSSTEADYNNETTSAGLTKNNSSTFTIFPNPANDFVTLNLSNLSGNSNEIRFTSMDGKVIETRKATQSKETFDISLLSSGIYFFQVGNVTQKVMVK